MLPAGTVLKGKYKVIRLLHEGGMGFVHEGEYEGNKCIIKEPKIGEGIEKDRYFLEKIKIEAEILNKIKHESIVEYLDSFEERNSFFLIEKYVPGEKLGEKYCKNPGNEKEVINYILQLLDAVKYLHNNNIKHRDINPNNLILSPDKKLILIDFGTAKYFLRGRKQIKGVLKSTMVGTSSYAPAEQWKGDTTEVSDIFSIGRTMYFMLTGEHPAESPYDRLDFMGTKIRRELADIVIKAAEPEIEDRYDSVVQMIDLLNAIKEDEVYKKSEPKERKWYMTIKEFLATNSTILSRFLNDQIIEYRKKKGKNKEVEELKKKLETYEDKTELLEKDIDQYEEIIKKLELKLGTDSISENAFVNWNLDKIKPKMSAFKIDVWVLEGDYQNKRDIISRSKSEKNYHVGEKINLYFKSEKDCYLTLLNYGTSGKLTVLFPNALFKDNFIEGNKIYAIPGQDYPFDYIINGPPGIEKIKAVAATQKLDLIEMVFKKGEIFTTSTSAARDISVAAKKIETKIETKELHEWSEARCEIRVV